MRKALIVSSALALVAPSLSAQTARSETQTKRWNDRPTSTWSDEAPRVRVTIEGPRAVGWGTPMRVRFEVSDNAYVAVVRVGDDGRMTILFPYSRNQRSQARGGMVHYVRNPTYGGNAAFIANDRMGGYVFAIASFVPLDFSMFENRDYNRIGGYSRFTVANRSIARRPDVFIDRFAAAVLWDKDTPYDYDVDYYFGDAFGGAFTNAYALCGSMFRTFGYSGYAYPGIGFMSTYHALYNDWYDWAAVGYPYRSMCSDYLLGLRCFSYIAFATSGFCRFNQVAWNNPQQPPVGGQPTDSTVVPNEGVVRGGLFGPTPTPIPVTAGGEAPPLERPSANGPPIGSFDQVRRAGTSDLDGALSIPTRATRKMKEDDARRDREATAPARAGNTGFDRAETGDKSPKTTAGAEPVTRPSAPPSREPTKAKGTSEPRRETGTRRGDFAGTTSRPSDPGIDRVSRPANTGSSTGSAGSSGGSSQPASLGGTSTSDKKKPPQE